MLLMPTLAPVQAANPWDWIPAGAGAVIRLQTPETTIQTVADFVNEVQPGFGGMIQGQQGSLGIPIFNPSMEGVDLTRDWYVAVFAKHHAKPGLLMIIPATDVDAIKQAVGDSFSFSVHDGWVVYSESTALVEQLDATASGDSPAISSMIDTRVRDQLQQARAGLFVNGSVLKEIWAAELAGLDEELDEIIDAIDAATAAAGQNPDLSYVWEMYQELGRIGIQGLRDSVSAAVTVNIQDHALHIDELLQVVDNSATHRFLASQPVSNLALLESLPDGLDGYFAAHGDPSVFFDMTERMMDGLLADEAASARYREVMKLFANAEFGDMVGAGDLSGDEDTGALRYSTITELKPAATMREALGIIGDGFEYEIVGMVQRMTVETNAEQIDGKPVDIMRLEQQIPAQLDPLGIQRAMNEKMYGLEGMMQRLMYHDGLVLTSVGGSSEQLKSLMHSDKWSDEQLIAARKRLLDQANIIVLADIPTYARDMAALILSIDGLPIPIRIDGIDAVEIPRSYAGFSIGIEGTAVHSRTVIPAETFQGLARLGMFVFQSLQGAN